ncbi:unnamed protein product, partial [Prorocentrum cordatum]
FCFDYDAECGSGRDCSKGAAPGYAHFTLFGGRTAVDVPFGPQGTPEVHLALLDDEYFSFPEVSQVWTEANCTDILRAAKRSFKLDWHKVADKTGKASGWTMETRVVEKDCAEAMPPPTWNMTALLAAVRNGEQRTEFVDGTSRLLEDRVDERIGAHDQDAPDNIFELLDRCLAEVGSELFTKPLDVPGRYAHRAKLRRDLLLKRIGPAGASPSYHGPRGRGNGAPGVFSASSPPSTEAHMSCSGIVHPGLLRGGGVETSKGSREFRASIRDMSDAFGSTSWEAMSTAKSTLGQPEHVVLCENRFRDAVVLLLSDQGELAVKTRVGGVVRDPFMAAACSTMFLRPVQQWTEDFRAAGPARSLSCAGWDGQSADLSHDKYADDLYRRTPNGLWPS